MIFINDQGELVDMYGSLKREDWLIEIINEVLQVIEMGAKKHGSKNWQQPNGSKSSEKDMHSSLFRHIASSSAGILLDKESGKHHTAHAICRLAMLQYRRNHAILHEEDRK